MIFMIHTLSMLLSIKDEEVFHLFSIYGHDIQKFDYIKAAIEKINQNLKQNDSAYRINWLKYKCKGNWKISVKVDLVKMLDKGIIIEQDYELVENHIRDFLLMHFGDDSSYDTLIRIDYKMDCLVPDERERELLFHLFEKYTRKYRFKQKIKWGKDDDGNPIKYDTSQYHKNESIEFIFYSKEDERIAKGEVIKDYERHVVRYEKRLKNPHLNAMKRRDKGRNRPKKLWCYFKEDLWKEYMEKHILPIVHKGDHYKIFEAEKVISKSTFSRNKKEKLRKFLISISKGSIDTPKKDMSPPTYRQYLKDLEKLKINPILIPKNFSTENHKSFPSYLKNPFKI